jgi:GxxExxY protein
MNEPSDFENRLSKAVIGAAIEVHRELGPGYIESNYEAALAHEFELRNIPFQRQLCFGVQYKSIQVGDGRLDFLVGEVLVVELKAVEKVLPIHKAQVISYLKAQKLGLGLLLNFNVQIMRDGIQRIILSD